MARADRDQAALRLWEDLIDSLNHMADLEDETEPGDEPKGLNLSDCKSTPTPKEDFSDAKPFIVQLHKALSEHFMSLSCRYQRESITVNIRLNWSYKQVIKDQDHLWFSLFFLNKDDTSEDLKAD